MSLLSKFIRWCRKPNFEECCRIEFPFSLKKVKFSVHYLDAVLNKMVDEIEDHGVSNHEIFDLVFGDYSAIHIIYRRNTDTYLLMEPVASGWIARFVYVDCLHSDDKPSPFRKENFLFQIENPLKDSKPFIDEGITYTFPHRANVYARVG